METTTFLLVLIHLLSVFFSIRFFKIAYSKNGIWRNLDMNPFDWFLSLMPFLNTLLCLVGWILFYPKKS